MSLEEALDKTDPMKTNTVTQGSDEEKAAIERFKDLFSVWTQENVLAKIRNLYAENVCYFDPFKELNDVAGIEAHFVRLLEPVESCTLEFQDVAVSGGDYYFRWVMEAKYKTFKKGQVFRSNGITHIRFDETGKVVFHMDYWDSASGLLEHIPLLGGLIKFIKGRV